MKVAYLIDRDSVGGGCEYIRQLRCGLGRNETKMFFSVEKQCRASVVNAWSPDVIHVNHLKALLQLFSNPACRPLAPVVFTVHGIHLRKFDFLPRTPSNRLKRFLRLRLERWLYGHCDRLIALTPTDKEYIQRVYHVSTPVSVIANGVALTPAASMPALRYCKDEFMFISIARFNFPKGQDILLRAISHRQTELRALGRRTLLIGGGEMLAELQDYVRQQKIDDLVEFAGEIPAASCYLDCGRVLIAPSRWEGFPMLVLEAAARHKFVMASDCPGNRDVVRDGETGLLFPVEEYRQLAELMIAEYDERTMRMRGDCLAADVAARFSVSGMTEATQGVYEEL